MNFYEAADRDFSIQFCEYNYSNPDYDQIYRPNGSGDYLFLLFKTPMKVYLDKRLSISKENACILYAPGYEQHYKAVHRFRNSYLHFSCKADLKKQYGIPLNTVFYPGNCEEIDACIRFLHKEHIANDLFSDEYEYTLFQQLMITIARGLKSHQIHGSGTEGDNLYSAFRKLRLEMLTNYAK
ncbi:MAG: AraC family transcriptional regulator, partial [Blautia faecis]